MVASIDGNSLGLGNSSLNTLGLQRGDPASGRNGEAVYVNAATGNLVVQHQDELLVGLGPDLPMLRTYNSQANTDGDNDDNWRIGFYRRLVDLDGDVNRAGSAITRIDGDGAYARYRYDASRGLYLNTDGAGAYDTLRFDSLTRLWSWTDGDSGVTETYQQDAATGHRQLIRQQDADGNSISYGYAANSLLQKVASANGQGAMLNQVELVYDTRPGQTANLLEVRSTAWDAASGLNLGITRVRYGYDEKQRLASVSVDLSPEDGSIADGQVYVTRYTYDGSSKRLAGISQSDGSRITITWKQVKDEQRVASLVNAQGELTRYDYDADRRVTTVTDPMGFETRYTHDAAGRLLQISAPPVDGVAQIRQFAYNDNGDVLRVTDAKGQVTERSYDRNGLLLQERDAAGNTVVRSYNAQNQLLSLTRYRTPDPDGRGPLSAAEPETTRYVYDPIYGYRLLFVISAEGRITEYRYNHLGQRSSQLQYTEALAGTDSTPDALQLQAWLAQRDLRLALRTDFSWDFRGQLESQTRYQRLDALGQGVLDGSQAVTRYVYSANGQLLQTIAPNGGLTQIVRDGLNREILRTNALGETTRTIWDDAGNRTLLTAANGLQSTLQYDSAGRLVTTLQSDPKGVLLSRSDYFYDDNGRLRATRDGTGVMRWMLYDAAGRKSAEVDGNGSLTEYRYDANDQITQTIQYAQAVRALWPPVMDVEVFNYSDPGLAADQPPLHTSLAGLGLTDQAHGEVLTPVTRFQSSGFNAEDARHFAATGNLKTYALRSSGSFTVFEEGDYSFYTRSDAGSRLYIDGQLVVDNDGLHEARTLFATVHLKPGVHSLVQTYFESTGAQVNQFGQGVSSTVLAQDVQSAGSPLPYSELTRIRPTAGNQDRHAWNVYDAADRLVASVDARGSVKRLEYDGAGRIVRRIEHAGQIDTSALGAAPTLAQILPLSSDQDRVSRLFYDQDGLLRATLDGEGYMTETIYDAAGQIQRSLRHALPVAEALRQSAGLDALRPAAHPDDRSDWRLYNARGDLLAQVDAQGYLDEFTYDAQGKLIASLRYARPVPIVLSAVQAAGDAMALLQALRPGTDSEDRKREFGYDLLDRLVQEVDAEGTFTRHAYDVGGQRIATTTAFGSEEARTRRWRHDLLGNLVAQLDGVGSAALDALGPDASVTEREAVWSRHATRYAVDAVGRRVSATDANGLQTRYWYDEDGNLRYSVNALGEVREERYDVLGQRIASIAHAERLDPASLPGGGLLRFYDARLLQEDTEASVHGYRYNLDGSLASSIDALGQHTDYAYDGFDGLIQTTLPANAGQTTLIQRQYDRRGLQLSERWLDVNTGAGLATSSQWDAFGQQIASSDANGNTAYTRYDHLGREILSTDAMANQRGTSWDAFGRVIAQSDALGNSVHTEYERQARSSTVITAEGTRVTTLRNRHNETTQIVDGRGNATTMHYDAAGRLLETRTPLTSTRQSYDLGGRLVESVDANGTCTEYSYDDANRLIASLRDPDGLRLETRQIWDAKGQLIVSVDARGVHTDYRYDLKGQLLQQVLDPSGLQLTTTHTWDARGQRVESRDAKGVVTRTVYDGFGRRVAELRDAGGMNLLTRHELDGNGNTLAMVDANGARLEQRYDANNRLILQVDGAGGLTRFEYDAEGRLISRLAHATALPGSVAGLESEQILVLAVNDPAQDRREWLHYDRDGRLIATVSGMGAYVDYRYDANGNLVRQRSFTQAIDPAAYVPGSLPAKLADDSPMQSRQTVYDALNRVIATLDASGALVEQSWDGNGNLLHRRRYANALGTLPFHLALGADTLPQLGAAVVDATHDRQDHYLYDAAGRLVWQSDGMGSVSQFEYDAAGNRVRSVQYATALSAAQPPRQVAASAQDRVTRSVLDAANRVIWQVDSLGAVSRLVYDDNGNLIRHIAYDQILPADVLTQEGLSAALLERTVTQSARDRITRYDYDAANRQVLAVDATGAATGTGYDALGRVLHVRRYAQGVDPANASAQANAGAQDRSTRQAYDAAGRLLRQVDALGHVTSMRYDALGQMLEQVQHARLLSGVPDFANEAMTVPAADVEDRITRMRHDADGHLLASIDALGATQSWTYDALGQKTSMRNALGQVWTYAYNAAGRLVREVSPQVMLSAVRVQNNGALAVDSAGSSLENLITALAYDALGNLLERVEAAGLGDERRTQYRYDAAGRQIKTILPRLDVYAPERDNVLGNGASGAAARVEQSATPWNETRYDALGNAVASRDVNGAWRHKAYDALGRVLFETDALRQVTAYTYNRHGEVIALTRHALPLNAGVDATNAQAIQAALRRDIADRSLHQIRDGAGRLLEQVEAVTVAHDASAAIGWQDFHAARQTRYTYNAFGEVVQQAELRNPLSNDWLRTRHWYDRLGRQVALLDAEGYLSTSEYDFAGNQVLHIEYAQALSAPDAAVSPDVVPLAPVSVQDRSLRTTWDRNNRKLRETRLNVEYADAQSGQTRRGDLSTQYDYDALGNLIASTDASGAVSRIWYDALGRITAQSAPARNSTPDNRALTPLTLYSRDAFGNLLVETKLAAGAASIGAQAYVVKAYSADDRVSLYRYNSHGHLLQSTDALGNSLHQSVDAAGRAVKRWQTVSAAEGSQSTLWMTLKYDAAGQLLEQRESLRADATIENQTRWNAFGEKILQTVSGGGLAGETEFFDYDQAGRLWRSNSGDGRIKIALYDLQGNATLELSSEGNSDPAQFQNAGQALADSHLRRNESRYDRLGRLVSQQLAERDVFDAALNINAQGWLSTPWAGQAQVNGIWQDLPRRLDASGQPGLDFSALPSGTFAVRLLDANGQVQTQGKVQVNAARAAQEVAAQGMPGIALQASQRMVGGLPTLIDAGQRMAWGNPGANVSQGFRYRAAGGAWQDAAVLALGDGYYGVDLTQIAAGAYEYELLLTTTSGKTQRFAGETELGASRQTGVQVLARDAQGQLTGGVSARVLQWKGGAAQDSYALRYRSLGGPWQNASILQDIIGVDLQGQLLGTRYVNTSLWGTGEFEYELRQMRNGEVVAQAKGMLSLESAVGAGQLQSTTPAYQAGYTLAGNSASYRFSQMLRPTVSQELDRWGNVLAYTDARNADWVTRQRFNANNQLLAQTLPASSGQNETTLEKSYDALGRLVAQSDGNGNLTRYTYDSAGQLVEERAADGGLVQYAYDAFGNTSRRIDALGQVTQYRYDRMGRLTQTQLPSAAVYGTTGDTRLRFVGYKALTQTTRYDEAGRAIAQTDGNGDTTITAYDLQGNVSMQRLAMGQASRYQYDAQGRMVWMQDANGNSSTWRYDRFGQLLEHRDLSGAVVSYRYDQARQLVEQTSTRGQHLQFGYDAAGQVIARFDLSLNQRTDSAYDAAGNKTVERMQQAGALYQDSVLTYDERGRMVQVEERSDGEVSIQIGYDGANNRRFIHTRVHAAGANQDEMRWFAYDSMNRQVLVNAANPNGALGSQGRRITYDLAGRRVSETWNGPGGEVTQLYRHDALNRLIATERNGIDIERRYYDGAGRIVQQGMSGLDEGFLDALNQGLPESDHISGEVQINRYNGNGWTEYQRVTGADGAAKYEVDYSNGYDALGNLLRYSVANHGDSEYTNTFVNHYEARDDYLVVRTDATSTEYEPGHNTRSYDANGNLIAIGDATKDANNRSYVNNAQGQAVWALQSGNVQRQLLANGQWLARYGVAVDRYQARDDEGNARFATLADVDFSFAAVNGRNPTGAGNYSVREGDSLKSIARQVYGDASYWYLLADANGLKTDSALNPSQSLRLPAAMLTQHNQQDTFKPYSADVLIGDTTPNMPPPEQDEGCGGLLQIIVIVVAVVVTIYTAGAAAGAMGVTTSASAGAATGAAGSMASTFSLGAAVMGGTAVGSAGAIMTAAAIGGAVGSIASQLTGMALGVQSGFSWTGVALGALSAGVTAGVGTSGLITGQSTLAVASRAVLSNAATQGIAVLTGLQPSFSWTNVAAAGVGAGVGSFVNGQLADFNLDGLGNFGNSLVRGAISGFAAGAATALLNGGRITITQIATDAFGNALANSLVEQMQMTQTAQAAVAPKAEPQNAAEVVEQVEQKWLVEETDVGPVALDIDSADLGPRTVRAGDYRGSLERIARAQLGPNATQREISNYVGQLFEINGISNARTIQPDRMILLPDSGTPAATDGLAKYGKDIALGLQQDAQRTAMAKASAQQAMQNSADAGESQWSFKEASAAQRRLDDLQAASANQRTTPTSVEDGPGLGKTGLSLGLDLMPVVGSAKSFAQVFTGTDLVTGEPVNRWLEGAGVILGVVPGGKALIKGEKILDAGIDVARTADKVLDAGVGEIKLGANPRLRQTGASGSAISADDAYAAIRENTKDVDIIANNTGIKPSNIQKVKDHLFYNEHLLDRYENLGIPAKLQRFDSNADIANSWKRLESGSHSNADIQLLRHETAEAWHMRKYGPSYNNSHNAAQRRYPSPLE